MVALSGLYISQAYGTPCGSNSQLEDDYKVMNSNLIPYIVKIKLRPVTGHVRMTITPILQSINDSCLPWAKVDIVDLLVKMNDNYLDHAVISKALLEVEVSCIE